jgi:hypothetical protein
MQNYLGTSVSRVHGRHGLRPGSGRLITAAPRPVVSSATAEDKKQYEYYQDSFHIITTSPGRNELSDIIHEHVLCQTG